MLLLLLFWILPLSAAEPLPMTEFEFRSLRAQSVEFVNQLDPRLNEITQLNYDDPSRSILWEEFEQTVLSGRHSCQTVFRSASLPKHKLYAEHLDKALEAYYKYSRCWRGRDFDQANSWFDEFVKYHKLIKNE